MTTHLPGDAPTTHAVTQAWWQMLPEVYQTADLSANSSVTYPLLNYLAALGDQLGQLRDLIDRIDVKITTDPVTGQPIETSELVSPTAADYSWLKWLAQLAGVTLTGLEPESIARAAITNAQTGWKAGTKQSIVAAVTSVLSGTLFVEVDDHNDGTGTPAGEWEMLVKTRSIETPDPTALLAAIYKAGAKPAGVRLTLGFTAASWDVIQADFTNWTALEAAPDWNHIESAL